jgi:hypothetical protein
MSRPSTAFAIQFYPEMRGELDAFPNARDLLPNGRIHPGHRKNAITENTIGHTT